MKIVVLDGITLNPNEELSWAPLKALGEVVIYESTPATQVVERMQGATIALTNKVPFTAATIAALPELKYIGVLATGFNIVDTDAAKEKGIVVTNIPAYSTMSVAQMVFAHLLNITQRVGHYADEVHNGRWDSNAEFCYWNTPLIELAGKRMGIVGFGNTGSATARIAQALGMEVWVQSSKAQSELPEGIRKAADLDELYAVCDVISLHCPLTAQNKEMINATSIAKMKDKAIFLNLGRGGLINEQDLADALRAGKLLAAGVDVLSTEPPRADNPLLKVENCFITPHIAWATYEARVRLMKQAVENLEQWQKGTPINNVAR
ncbi:MAG: D-2-hydroxyacid dehydrogenase [Phocaeicola sp.]|nr:D-2-hydroxyacid dehydrogenase [Phocaeicola sp.]MDD7448610.1 D-2-hydroxyacid dehydrogenase [Prevotellaceae bacterium]MDY3914134.1 D-2-hydroxyacid dehydrogenase [Phocaeicola sp.]MDY5939148.1 D-2-hydroxyacid dehydrogenase [Phocaeicola sp.]